MGQKSIFGSGRGPVFAKMPTYTPVTRATEPREQHEQRRQADHGNFGTEPPSAGFPGIDLPDLRSLSAGNGAREAYAPQETDRSEPQSASQGFQQREAQFTPKTHSEPHYQQQDDHRHYSPDQDRPDSFHGNSPAFPSHSRPGHTQQPASQSTYQNPSFSGPAFSERSFQPSDTGSTPADADFSGGNFRNASFADASYDDASFADQSYPDASFPDASFPDASFPDASFPESGYGAAASENGFLRDGMSGGFDPRNEQAYGTGAQNHSADDEVLPLESPAQDYGMEHGQEAAMHDYVAHAAEEQGGHMGALPPGQSLQAFDAIYDQPPQIQLGATSQQQDANFYGEPGDADFLDEAQLGLDEAPAPAAKTGGKYRSIFMVGSALLGAIALGGALAFAYKQSGGSMSEGEPPLVQADNSPVKQPPQQPGGKEFPHKNKLIYERLQSGDQPEAERIVPRQEELAMPAMPGAAPAQAPVQAAPVPPATVDDPAAADGGPRRVKTLVVRPDGSVVPSEPATPAAPQPVMQQVANVGAAAQPPGPVPAAEPAPASPPAPQQAAPAADPQPVAAIPPPTPAPAAEPKPARPSQYVVQVGSKQNQTEALATFADLQQKYPSLLASYRPIVQKANLGAKGVWYRLRIGPISDKSAASKLCSQLKSQGHPDCLVVAAQ